jgi:hypothetical protein
MSQWAVDVRYPGVPDPAKADGKDDPGADFPGAEVGSMTVCGPDHTTLHIRATADTTHEALELGQRCADRVAGNLGLDIRHAAAAVPVP